VKPGPQRKPAAKAKAQGNPGKRPIRTQKGGAPSDSSVPDWLDDAGRAIWSLYLPKLTLLRYFRDTDRLSFARYCDHTARWLRLRGKVDKKGESYWTKSKHGKMLRRNPDFQAMLALEDRMRQLEDRFGLAPASREAILARLNEPTTPPLVVKQPGDQSPGMPASPLGMLSPAALARPPSTH